MAGSFALDLSKFAKKTMINYDLLIKKVIFDIFADIVWATPTDTGRARGGWQIGGSLVSGEIGELDKSGMGALSKGKGQVQGLVTRASVIGYIYNNVVYIKRLEDGHSQQAPRGMVKVTLTRWQSYINKAAASL
jgi:hypothetical protein